MSKSLEASPLQARALALADLAGMKGVRSADVVAGEMALLSSDQQTKARKRIITSDVCHALRKVCRRGLMVAFHAPDGYRYFALAVLQAALALQTAAVGQSFDSVAMDDLPLNESSSDPIEQRADHESNSSLAVIEQQNSAGVIAPLHFEATAKT
jgi:hypothetical protein